MVRGMSSGVSSQAKPIIMPWSPAPVSSSGLPASPWRASQERFTPAAMSRDCSLMAVTTPQVSQSKPMAEDT